METRGRTPLLASSTSGDRLHPLARDLFLEAVEALASYPPWTSLPPLTRTPGIPSRSLPAPDNPGASLYLKVLNLAAYASPLFQEGNVYRFRGLRGGCFLEGHHSAYHRLCRSRLSTAQRHQKSSLLNHLCFFGSFGWFGNHLVHLPSPVPFALQKDPVWCQACSQRDAPAQRGLLLIICTKTPCKSAGGQPHHSWFFPRSPKTPFEQCLKL